MPHQLPLFFSYQAPGRIWQIKADATTSCLAIEVRNQLQEVSFSYVCPLENKVLFEGLTIEGGLLTRLMACHRHSLLFQQFDDLENPANAMTIALDAATQEVAWAVEHYRHYFFWEQESIGKTGEEGVQEVWTAIHLQNGGVRELAAQEIEQLLTLRHTAVGGENILLPAGYQEGEAHFTTVAEFLQMYLQLQALKSCEYLHVFDKMAISFYTAHGERMANHLAIFDAEGGLQLHKVIAKELLQPGSETFMVWNNQLFFVENSSNLRGYNL